MGKLKSSMLIGILFAAGISGCATSDKKPTITDAPVVKAKAAGEVYLAINFGSFTKDYKSRYKARRKFLPDKCTVVKLKDGNGNEVAQLVSPMAPGDLLLEVLKQELREFGYSVKIVHSLPVRAVKGVELSGIYPDMELIAGGMKNQATSKLSVSLNIWRHGVKVKTADYEAKASDYEIGDRDILLRSVMNQSLADIARQAMPDIVKVLEKWE